MRREHGIVEGSPARAVAPVGVRAEPEKKPRAEVLEDVFARRGMTLKSKARAESVVASETGVVVTLGDGSTVEGSHCLIAVGSIPNTATIGLDTAGVLTDEVHLRAVRLAARGHPD